MAEAPGKVSRTFQEVTVCGSVGVGVGAALALVLGVGVMLVLLKTGGKVDFLLVQLGSMWQAGQARLPRGTQIDVPSDVASSFFLPFCDRICYGLAIIMPNYVCQFPP